jgi:HEAT repeat protein
MTLLCAWLMGFTSLSAGQDAQAALERFRKAYKGGDEERAAAVGLLATVKDRKILEALSRVLDDPAPSVRTEAVSALAAYEKDAEAAQAVSRVLAASKKWPDVQVACLDALGRIRDWNSAPAVIEQFGSVEVRAVGAALKAAGKIRNPAFVEPLIKFLRNTGAGTGKPGSWVEHSVNRALMVLAAQGALQQITGESRRHRPDRAADAYQAPRDADGWEAWWKEHGAEVTARLKKEELEELERISRPPR